MSQKKHLSGVRIGIGSIRITGREHYMMHVRIRIRSPEESFHFTDDLVNELLTESSPGGKKNG